MKKIFFLCILFFSYFNIALWNDILKGWEYYITSDWTTKALYDNKSEYISNLENTWIFNINSSISYSWWITYVINTGWGLNRVFYNFDIQNKTINNLKQYSWSNSCWDRYVFNHQVVLDNNNTPYVYISYRDNKWTCSYTNYNMHVDTYNLISSQRTKYMGISNPYSSSSLKYNWFIKNYYLSSIYWYWIISYTNYWGIYLSSITTNVFNSPPTCSFVPNSVFSHNWIAYFYKLDSNILRFCKINEDWLLSNYTYTLPTWTTYTLLNHDYYKWLIYIKNASNNIIKYNTTTNNHLKSDISIPNLYFVFNTTDLILDNKTIWWSFIYDKKISNFINNEEKIENNNFLLWKTIYWYNKSKITNTIINDLYLNFLNGINNQTKYIIRKGFNVFTIDK